VDYLPIFLDLIDQPCLVVGGGVVATRKSAVLVQARAKVTVLSHQLSPTLQGLVDIDQIHWLDKSFDPADLSGFRLVVAATDQDDVNRAVSEAAKTAGIPVNVVDRPALCSFIFPAIIDRSPVIAAVSSGGAAPVLARLIRVKLEAAIPPAYGALAGLAERFRARVKALIPDNRQRRHFWEQTLQGTVADLVFAGKTEQAAQELERTAITQSVAGMVYLVGAGPGDPDLLTVRALRLIQEADIVVYDRLVSPEIMALVRKDAEKIYAGKQSSHHTLPQDRINRLLADLAKAGNRVVRLKGGDPFIFGRGGEEIETLMDEGIAFQVVPGITAASGCAAYAGIPLTHRDYAQSVTFVTGHLKDGQVRDLDWARLAAAHQTLVIYMGLQGLDAICAELIAHGSAPDLPAALVQQGTTQNQRVIAGTLADLPALVQEQDIHAPTLVIVGEVVRLNQKLAWYEPAALKDCR
jgi:uroporphyrin-III C-methyltransferase/precorrin-2 dehydrogenase/sirohydrochlorin ferrochelatase